MLQKLLSSVSRAVMPHILQQLGDASVVNPGGSHAAAEVLGWRTQRRRRHESESLENAAHLVRQYIEALPNNARGRMPTQTEVRASGRHDIRYALQVQCFLSVLFTF